MQTTEDIPHPAAISISVFRSVEEQCAHDYTLQQFIDIVKSGSRYVPTIAHLRSIDKSTNKDLYNATKKRLCAFSLSCRCTPGCSRTQHPESNNGIMCVDIDAQDNPHLHDWAKVRDALGLLKYCYMAALSAGGRGVFCLMAVDPATPHEVTFDAVRTFFADRLHIAIDKSCRDIARLRYVSHDPDAIVRQPTEVFKVMQAPHPIHAIPQRRQHATMCGDSYDRVRAAVRIWQRRRIALDSYDDWTTISAAFKDIPDGSALLDMVSQYGSNYKGEAEQQRKFKHTATMQRIGVGSFFHLCTKYGISDEDIAAELKTTAEAEQPMREHTPTTAGKTERQVWTAANAPSYPRAAGETEQQAKAANAYMLNQAWAAYDLLKDDFLLQPPTPNDIVVLDLNTPAPQYAPF